MAVEVDLEGLLEDRGDGWRSTPWVSLGSKNMVADPTRPGRFIWGPAKVQLEVAPDQGRRLRVR
jgi:hypothetical protein